MKGKIMIIKKEKTKEIVVLIADTDTHARKLTYSYTTDESGRYILKNESDLTFFMDVPPEGKTAAEAGLENKLRHGYVKLSEAEFKDRFQQE